MHNNGHITARLLLTDKHTTDGFVVPLNNEDRHLGTSSAHYMKCNRDIQKKKIFFSDFKTCTLPLLSSLQNQSSFANLLISVLPSISSPSSTITVGQKGRLRPTQIYHRLPLFPLSYQISLRPHGHPCERSSGRQRHEGECFWKGSAAAELEVKQKWEAYHDREEAGRRKEPIGAVRDSTGLYSLSLPLKCWHNSHVSFFTVFPLFSLNHKCIRDACRDTDSLQMICSLQGDQRVLHAKELHSIKKHTTIQLTGDKTLNINKQANTKLFCTHYTKKQIQQYSLKEEYFVREKKMLRVDNNLVFPYNIARHLIRLKKIHAMAIFNTLSFYFE